MKEKKYSSFAPLFQRRLKKALWIAWFLQLAPFVRMIGLNGSMTRNKIRKESDIDFLIIAKQGRIWTTRFFITILTHLTGQRRYGEKIAGRICLNRYQTDHFLKIKPYDFYHARTFSSLVPLLDQGLYPQYQKVNKWMLRFGHKIKPGLNVKLRNNIFLGMIRRGIEKTLEGRVGDWIETKLKLYQIKRIISDIRTFQAPRSRIRVSDEEICLHPLKQNRGKTTLFKSLEQAKEYKGS